MPSAADSWLRCGDGFITLDVVARPGAPRKGILRRDARGLLIGLNAPPDKGKANDELLAFLAHLLKLPRSAISIIRGASSRQKTVRIECTNPPEMAARLHATTR